MGWTLMDLVDATKSYTIIDFPFLIGRNTHAQIICRNSNISKNHAKITTNHGKLFITDNSSNGVYVNDVKLVRGDETEIKHNDEISLCFLRTQYTTVLPDKYYAFKLIADDAHLLETPPPSATDEPVEENIIKEIATPVPSTSEQTLEVPAIVVAPVTKMEVDDFGLTSPVGGSINNIHEEIDSILQTLESPVPKIEMTNVFDEAIQTTVVNKSETDAANRAENQKVEEPKEYNQIKKENIGIKHEIQGNACLSDNSDVIVIQDEQEIIVIDDDEKEAILSQLFIKQEADSDFINIKKEFDEMHWGDIKSEEVYEISDSDCDSQTDELSRLNASLRSNDSDVVFLENLPESPEIMFEKSPEHCNMPITPVEVTAPFVAEESTSVVTSISEDLNLKKITDSIALKHKVKTPNVIESLPLVKNLGKRKKEDNTEKPGTKSTTEEKSKSRSKGKSKSKRRKLSKLFDEPEETSPKRDKEKEKETKKEKLRLIESNKSKNVQEKTSKTKERSHGKPTVKVKTSENRGKFLIETKQATHTDPWQSKPSTSQTKPVFSRIPKKQVAVVSPNPKEYTVLSQNQAIPQTNNYSNVRTTSPQVVPLIDTSMSTFLNNGIEIASKIATVTQPKTRFYPFESIDSGNNRNESNTNRSNKVAVVNVPAPYITRQSVQRPPRYNADRNPTIHPLITEHILFIKRLFYWSISYFKENADITALWPHVYGHPMTRLSTTYSDYRYYQSCMHMVIISELFNDVHQAYNSTPLSRSEVPNYTCVFVKQVIRHSDYSEIVCLYYIGEKQLNDKVYDLSLLSFIPAFRGSKPAANLFGVVGWSGSERLGQGEHVIAGLQDQCKSSPWYKHTFSILAKPEAEINERMYLYFRQFGTVRRHLHKFSAISKVEGALAHQLSTVDPQKFVIPNFPLPETIVQYLPLNSKQHQVVVDSLRFCTTKNSNFFLVQGPPGTGKSNVIVNTVLNLLRRVSKGEAVLLLAQTNAAVDNLMRRIETLRKKSMSDEDKHRVRMVRIGQVAFTASELAEYHVDSHVQRYLRSMLFNISPHLKHHYRILTEEIYKLKNKSYRSKEEDSILEDKEKACANFVKDHFLRQYRKEEFKARNLVLQKANLICSTIGSVYTFPNHLVKLCFKCCIIDEATQATEPDTLVPLTLGVDKFILVGDTRQLPPHNTLVPKDYLFTQSLFARLQRSLRSGSMQNALHLLDTQYRMRQEICAFPNQMFYGGGLQTVMTNTREDIQHLPAYLVFEQDDLTTGRSYVNYREVETVLMMLNAISKVKLKSQLTVGVITPYNDQRNEFLKKLEGMKLNPHIKVMVHTIDGIQGQEQDIILLSFVLKLANRFLNDPNRLNVALTRARHCFYIFGSPVLFGSGCFTQRLQADAIHRNVYIRLPPYVNSNHLENYLVSK